MQNTNILFNFNLNIRVYCKRKTDSTSFESAIVFILFHCPSLYDYAPGGIDASSKRRSKFTNLLYSLAKAS